MNIRTKRLIAGISFAGLLDGCAAVVPHHLLEARAAYTASINGLAGTLTPSELRDAKLALDQATKEFESNGDTAALLDYAYIARRRVELADAVARAMMDRRALDDVTPDRAP